MIEVEVCRNQEHDWSSGEPVRLVVVPGCKACQQADDELVASLGEHWRLPWAQTIPAR